MSEVFDSLKAVEKKKAKNDPASKTEAGTASGPAGERTSQPDDGAGLSGKSIALATGLVAVVFIIIATIAANIMIFTITKTHSLQIASAVSQLEKIEGSLTNNVEIINSLSVSVKNMKKRVAKINSGIEGLSGRIDTLQERSGSNSVMIRELQKTAAKASLEATFLNAEIRDMKRRMSIFEAKRGSK